MTKNLQNKILNQLELQKSLGFKYIESPNISSFEDGISKLPEDLLALENMAKNCYLCELSKTRKNVLFSSGNINSNIVVIKQTASMTEDEIGEFYTGKSGELLVNMIEKVLEIKKEDIYITNILKCICTHTDIKASFVNSCKGYLETQLKIIKPKLIIALGEEVYQYFTNDSNSFNEVRGKVITKDDFVIIPIYEADFLLRNPTAKKEAFEDLLKIKKLMESF